ncbi:MAG: endolytic transglycosylase MltG [Anaplasmataceae bacterium]|nr:endolytic transglycosylase MltG [Anaplasmataceae bacterium]
MPSGFDRSFIINVLVLMVLAGLWFGVVLRPLSQTAAGKMLVVQEGEGVMEISQKLKEEDLIRSSFAFRIAAFLKGEHASLKPGNYTFFSSSSTLDILGKLVHGDREEVVVRIPQGATVFEIDTILTKAGIISSGEVVREVEARGGEGELFPDTYRFFMGSSPQDIVFKMRSNFENKTSHLFEGFDDSREDIMVMASLIEREVPNHDEARIVAGILWNRIKSGMPLQIDASICHPKLEQYWKEGRVDLGCGPITSNDLKIDSPYNTYLNKGLPPGPIGSPGLTSIEAALHPNPSSYLFYLSDPRTGKTIFARNFDEHRANINRYLR